MSANPLSAAMLDPMGALAPSAQSRPHDHQGDAAVTSGRRSMHPLSRAKILPRHIVGAFSYDPETGCIERLVKSRGTPKPSTELRPLAGGYIYIYFEGVGYPAHRVAWFFQTGTDPDQQVDHINGVRTDNRAANLRLASHAENSQNTRTRSRKNGLPRGVIVNGSGTFRAQVVRSGQKHNFGTFATAEEAHEAYVAGVKKLHGDFAWVKK